MSCLASALLLLATVTGWNGSDDFRGTALNWCNWENTSVDAAVTQNEELLLSTRGDRTYSSASVRTQYLVSSDFDFSVDYKLMSGWDAAIVAAGPNPRIDIAITLLVDGGSYQLAVIRSKDAGGEAITL